MLEIGTAKTDITAYEPGLPMFGWGHPENTSDGVSMPLYVRAFVIKDPKRATKVALCVAELGCISLALRQGVLDQLAGAGWDEASVLLTSTHTHSGPGGLSHYLFYCAATSGYSSRVVERVVSGIVESILRAEASCQPGEISFNAGEIPLDHPVAFNRSVGSFNSNPEVSPEIQGELPAEAVDRRMRLLFFRDGAGRPLGALSFFGVHGTSVHSDNHLLHPDNKGCAAAMLEAHAARAWGSEDFVAAFAQAPCGDVTPNFRYDVSRRFTIGLSDDDFRSARANGSFQGEQALRLAADLGARQTLEPRLDGAFTYADMSRVELLPRFADGLPGQRTDTATIGFRMLFGTSEGPGLPLAMTPPVDALSKLKRRWLGIGAAVPRRTAPPWLRGRSAQGNKLGFLDTGNGASARLFGLRPVMKGNLVADRLHPFPAYISRVLSEGGGDQNPWTPQILPLQIVVIGRLALATLPGEPTTVSGWRLRRSLLQRLAPRGVTEVIVIPYANAYAGYITTPREYDQQVYEGASTHFGRWTLGGYQTVYDRLARRLLLPIGLRPLESGPQPPRFSSGVLAARSYRSS